MVKVSEIDRDFEVWVTKGRERDLVQHIIDLSHTEFGMAKTLFCIKRRQYDASNGLVQLILRVKGRAEATLWRAPRFGRMLVRNGIACSVVCRKPVQTKSINMGDGHTN